MYQLDKGIFLEDKNVLLEWGQPLEKIAADNSAKIIKQADRTIIDWGTHTILDGLTLELTNVFLLSTGFQLFKKFKSIGHQTVGDKQSFENFSLISKHLLNKIGEPSKKDDSIEREKSWIWQTSEVKINLYLFEQHAFKLHLTIEQI
jgi:hypothetical protein